MNLKILLILIFLGMILLTLVALKSFGGNKQQIIPSSSPSSQQQQEGGPYSTQYINESKTTNEQIKPFFDKQNKIAAFTESLPYKGKNFTAKFDFKSGDIIVALDPNNLQRANQEFDTYLKSFGVEERSWIDYLVVR